MKILFMGTPDIAAAVLESLVDEGHEICGVFTRLDKPVGRKNILTPTPVKLAAERMGIPVWQPKTLRDGSFDEVVKAFDAELIVVVAYGLILPASVLGAAKYGCINLHPSLLPKYRGPAPIQWTIINGDRTGGVTVMYMDEGVDTGDIILQRECEVAPDDTSASFRLKVTEMGKELVCEAVRRIADGTAERFPQGEEGASRVPMLNKEMALVDFEKSAKELDCLIRGLIPWPAAYFICAGKRVKILEAAPTQGSGKAGEILSLSPMTIACREGALRLIRVVPEGQKEMTADSWANGRRFKPGEDVRKGF